MKESILDRIARFIAIWTGNDPELVSDPLFPEEKKRKETDNETEQSL